MLLGGSSFLSHADSIGITSTIASRNLIAFLHGETYGSSRDWNPRQRPSCRGAGAPPEEPCRLYPAVPLDSPAFVACWRAPRTSRLDGARGVTRGVTTQAGTDLRAVARASLSTTPIV